jgi:hypothetical protein
VVFELPWDGQGSGDVPLMFAAVSSAGAGWSGAELSVATGDGSIIPIGQSGRARSVIGTAIDALGNASPHLLDRANTITVDLLGNDMALASATPRQLADGANRAFLGDELLQFGTATALGGGRWQLGLLLRGRGGTEHRIAGHLAGEPFVLLDETPVALESALVGNAPDARIAAVGLMDAEPVLAPIRNRGLSLQPLAPVHGRGETLADGSLVLSWTRRSRGAWRWLDGVDVPLREQAEAYEVSLMQAEVVAARWAAPSPSLTIDAAQVSNLRTNFPGGELRVRQRGTYALSPPVKLASFS